MEEGLGSAMESPSLVAFPSLLAQLPFSIFQLGRQAFKLLHEWSHLGVAFIIAPWAWQEIFSSANLRGHQSWKDFWAASLKDEVEGHPVVRISQTAVGWRDAAVRYGGWGISVLVPIAALFYFGWHGHLTALSVLPLTVSSLFGAGGLWALYEATKSDWFDPHTPGVYSCGNVVLLAHASVSLPDLLRVHQDMLWAAARRGHISGGVTVKFNTRPRKWVSWILRLQAVSWITRTVRARVNNSKRGDLASKMIRHFRVKLVLTLGLLWILMNSISFQVAKILHSHVRYPTWSVAKPREAHPQRGGKPRTVQVWEIERVEDVQTGKVTSLLVKHLRRVEDCATHNGDFNGWFWGWKWRGTEYGSRTVGQWMDRVLYERASKPWAQYIFEKASKADAWARDKPKNKGLPRVSEKHWQQSYEARPVYLSDGCEMVLRYPGWG